MRVGDAVLGFDPGGDKRFGWAVCVNEGDQLRVQATGVASDANDAMTETTAHLSTEGDVAAAGVDAPLCWGTTGGRRIDDLLRQALLARGYRNSRGGANAHGVVQDVNQLRGACLAQGILLGSFLHEAFPDAKITEAHPKALLWLLGIATRVLPASDVGLDALPHLAGVAGVNVSEHARDAVIAALAAWSMCKRKPGWRNLFEEEPSPVLPLDTPVSYWMPLP